MGLADELWLHGGDAGRDLANVDWSQTALGDPETWPASLRSAIRIVLTSKFSMWMAWGPDLTFFCNDSYRRDTLANKYPWALGRPASEVWAEIWPDIGPRIDQVLRTGEATWDESLLLFLERSGYVEETYHTFSYSPLTDDDGAVVGMLCVVKEDTAQVIANRRMATVRDLGARPTGLDEGAAIHAACRRLANDARSLPFTLVYVYDPADGRAHLAGTSGVDPGHQVAPQTIGLDDPRSVWPAASAMAGEVTRLDGLRTRFADLPKGVWDDPPDQAFVVPLLQPTQTLPYGFLVASINPYRRADDAFEGFVTLLATQLAAIITDARAFQFEKQRAESLAQLDQAKTDFFTNISHEFRTPLTLMLGPAEEALADAADPLSPGQRDRTVVIHRNAVRLLKLVNNLLDFSRLESTSARARFDPVDLARYTRELASMFESAAARAGLTLVIDCEDLPTEVYVDQEQWAKVVLNLVSNALKFTFDGSIEVRLVDDGDYVLLTVADTGTGIPADEQPRLFERFHRVRGAAGRTTEGTGIGLALVSEITAMHGGTIEAESELGVGTTFSVRIPLGSAHLPPDQVGVAAEQVDPSQQAESYVSEALQWLDVEPDAPEPEVASQGAPGEDLPRVLVVDDNDDMREYVASLLRPSYDVVTAVDGVDALRKAAQRPPDLVVTDVMMPNLDGFGLVSRLHSEPATTGIPIIMLSARAGDDGVVEGLEAGADDYLVKPFSSRELLARVAVNLELDRMRRVRSTLERSQDLLDQAQRLAKVGSWELDAETDQLRGSEEFYRILGVAPERVDQDGFRAILGEIAHPDDVDAVVRVLSDPPADAVTRGVMRIRTPAGQERTLEAWAEMTSGEEGRALVRGSVQDITEQRELERSLAASLAKEEAAAREHAIAEYLQRSLLPERTFDLERLQVATYYRAGVEGTQVGGDWYDVFELGGGRVALVVGDVMGRGVPAASVMGQMRSAVRTLGKLDLSPEEIVEQLDAFVGDLDVHGYQMVTCVYAVFDPIEQSLAYANAGHVPPFVRRTDGEVVRLDATAPPLGAGGSQAVTSRTIDLPPQTRLLLYTDGLVEQRGEDLDDGMRALERELVAQAGEPVSVLPERLVRALRPEGPDDDVALLVCQVDAAFSHSTLTHRVAADASVMADTRRVVVDQLRAWGLEEAVVSDVALTTHELVTNALVHGVPPVDLRLVNTGSQLVVEVHDRSTDRPRRRAVQEGDERGRGLQVVAALANDWGARVGSGHKTVWATHALTPGGR